MAERRSVTFRMVLEDAVTPVAKRAQAAMEQTAASAGKAVTQTNVEIAGAAAIANNQIDQAAVKTGKLQGEMKQAGDATKGVASSARQAAAETDKAANAAGRAKRENKEAAQGAAAWAKNASDINQTMGRVAKIAAIAGAAVKGIAIASDGVKLAQAAIRGDLEAQAAAAGRIESGIRSLPIAGDAIADLGASINDLGTATINFAKGGRFISERGLTEEVQKQTALVEKQAKRLEERNRELKTATDHAKQFTDQLRDQLDTQEESQRRQLQTLEKTRQEIFDNPAFIATRGGMAVRTELLAGIDALIARLRERSKIEAVLQAKEYSTAFEEERLRSINRTAQAERVAFVQSLNERQREAAKISQQAASMTEKINSLALAAFDAAALRKRQAVLADLDDDLGARLLRATGRPMDERAAEFLDLQVRQQRERRDVTLELTEAGVGDEEIVKRQQQLEIAQQQELQQLRIKQAIDQTAEAHTLLGERIELANQLANQGSISLFEAQGRGAQAMKRYQEEIAKVIRLLIEMRNASTDPATQQAISEQITRIQLEAQRAKDEVRTYGSEIEGAFRGPIASAFSGLATDFENARDIAVSFLDSLAQGFINLAAQIAQTAIIQATIKPLLSSFGLFDIPLGFSQGGLVPGVGRGDTVPARLEPGEYVLDRDTVEAVSVGWLESFRARLKGRQPEPVTASLPLRMNTGGQVPDVAGAGPHAIPVMVSGEDELDRLLAGGGNALVNAIGRKREAVRTALGL